MNNKGVTLIELLIVIVVLGIISAFAIPAVGNIIENTEKGAVYNDALQIENAAKLYCQTNATNTECDGTDGRQIYWTQSEIDGAGTIDQNEPLNSYVDSFDSSDYSSITITYDTNSANGWVIQLEAAGATGALEWTDGGTTANDGQGPDDLSPSDLSKDSVTEDQE
ncbi:MAG: prepilin-type N-terminal cleavage/methylation domain-containing protein [Candidatus Izemoplasma sp.]|nr:prepilin-type N-terminal cleavage/methylation domain-containing protein [Candidatus Izemoplasma sp.]